LEGNLPAETGDEELSVETWDFVAPSRRYVMLTDLHRSDPGVARALIAEMAPKVAADQRLRLLQCLRWSLTDDDIDLLKSFEGDRSSKVQVLVKTQLARLGTGVDSDAEAAAEVTDYVEVAKAGILSRKRVVTARKLKTDAQKKRRAQVFAKMSLGGLADALGVSADEVIDTWEFGDGTNELVGLVAATGNDAQVNTLARRAIEAKDLTPDPLIARLDKDTRLAFGLEVLAHDSMNLPAARQWIAEPEGNVSWDALQSLPFKDYASAMAESKNRATEAQAAEGIIFLGLIADRDAANRILETIVASGVLAVDPRLTLLRLNAAL